ncbi:MAG: hypothetical protein HYY18_09665 [Planctomycetes bacterium]|nr:hypothetical protein [Planctomycetota bacterium]
MRFALAVLAALAALPALADNNVNAPSAQGVELYGDLKIKTFGRSGAMNEALDRTNIGGPDSDSDTGSYLTATIGLRLLLEKRVSVTVELENRELVREGEGTAAVRGLWGGEDDLDFDVHFGQAFIEIRDMLVTGVSLKAGIQDFKVDPAGTGHPFFMDLRRSESPFWTSVQEAQLVQANAAAGLTGLPSADGLIKDRQYDAGGFRLGYALNENVEVSAFWFTTFEGGTAHDDQWLYGGRLDMNLLDKDKPSTLTLLATVFSNDGNNHRVYTYGGGLGLRLKALTFHLEGYWQHGEYGEFTQVTDDDTEGQRAWSGIVGVYYRPEVDAKEAKFLVPFFSVSGRAYSGDRGENTIADSTGTQPDKRRNRDFLSMEGNNELMILEDDVLGLDVDSNYWSVRVGGGLRLSLLEASDFDIGLLYAYSRTMALVDFDLAGADSSKDLGHEVDLTVRWHQSELLSLGAGFGILWNGEIWGTSSNSLDDLGFRTDSQTMWMWSFDISVTF